MYTCIPLHIHKYMCSKVQIPFFFLVKYELLYVHGITHKLQRTKYLAVELIGVVFFITSITSLILRIDKTLTFASKEISLIYLSLNVYFYF